MEWFTNLLSDSKWLIATIIALVATVFTVFQYFKKERNRLINYANVKNSKKIVITQDKSGIAEIDSSEDVKIKQ